MAQQHGESPLRPSGLTQPLPLLRDRHEGPVWQIAWAHPKFGPILASSSYDGKVFIWKDSGSAGAAQQQQGGYNSQPYGGSMTSSGGWTKIKEHALHSASGESGNRRSLCCKCCKNVH